MFPSIKDVAAELTSIKRRFCASVRRPEFGLDVRLQVTEAGDWCIRTGDASYDQDHRGFWGAGSIGPTTNCRDLACELLEEAREHHAQTV